MTDQSHRFWDRVSRYLHRNLGSCPKDGNEADEAYRSAPETELSSQDIKETMRVVLSGELATWEPVSDLADEESVSAQRHPNVFQGRSDDSGLDDTERQEFLDELKRKAQSNQDDVEKSGEKSDEVSE